MSGNGKVAIVTGGGTGVGKAAALALHGDGYSVVIAGRRTEPLTQTIEESGDDGSRMMAVPTDVTDPDQIKTLFGKCMDSYGRLDVLFNNAGMGAPSVPLEDLSLEIWSNVVNLTLTDFFICTQEAIKIMKAQDPMGGRIINNGSLSAHVPRPNSVAYTSTKHAITGLTKSTSLDGRKYNIACSQIDIGNAGTPMTERMGGGVPQPNGEMMAEPRFDVAHVGKAILDMSNLPLDTNVLFMTIMATNMPYVGRG